MKKQAISLIILSALLMCGSSQAKTDNNAASDALFTNIAAVDEAGCDGTSDTLPCDEQIQEKKGGHDLFSTVSLEDRVWLDEIEECTWYEDNELYTILEDEDTLLDADDLLEDELNLPEERLASVDDERKMKVKQAMAAIAVKPIPREVKKPKPNHEQSKPKSRVAKIKPKEDKKKADKVEKKQPTVVEKSSAVDKSRTVQRAVTYTVRGKSYTTVPDSTGFVQKGEASWYGKRFHGLTTASGEPYDMNAMTAAHKKLPLGTKIEVINNENGKKVVVTVNDRGPFHGNRVLDLSKAAAQKLGVVDQGIADVTIRAL